MKFEKGFKITLCNIPSKEKVKGFKINKRDLVLANRLFFELLNTKFDDNEVTALVI